MKADVQGLHLIYKPLNHKNKDNSIAGIQTAMLEPKLLPVGGKKHAFLKNKKNPYTLGDDEEKSSRLKKKK